MEAAKAARTHEAHKQETQPQGGRMGHGAQVEVSDLADQEVSEGEVEDAPEDVDGRRGESLTGRLGEGALKRTTQHPAHEVGDRVAEKSAAEEVRDAM